MPTVSQCATLYPRESMNEIRKESRAPYTASAASVTLHGAVALLFFLAYQTGHHILAPHQFLQDSDKDPFGTPILFNHIADDDSDTAAIASAGGTPAISEIPDASPGPSEETTSEGEPESTHADGSYAVRPARHLQGKSAWYKNGVPSTGISNTPATALARSKMHAAGLAHQFAEYREQSGTTRYGNPAGTGSVRSNAQHNALVLARDLYYYRALQAAQRAAVGFEKLIYNEHPIHQRVHAVVTVARSGAIERVDLATSCGNKIIDELFLSFLNTIKFPAIPATLEDPFIINSFFKVDLDRGFGPISIRVYAPDGSTF